MNTLSIIIPLLLLLLLFYFYSGKMKSHFNYRTARPEDWPAIIEMAHYAIKSSKLNNSDFDLPVNEETWASIFHSSTLFICESNTTIIASACLTNSSIPLIKLLFVHPDYLKKGVATGLINKIIESVQEQGIPKLLACDCTGNTLPLLLKLGFIQNSETEKIYGENYLLFNIIKA